jgi:hypothetical protein
MAKDTRTWLPLDLAAAKFGYSKEGFRHRLRRLRELGYVVDTGRPPASYNVSDTPSAKKVVILWANPKTALIRSDAPAELFVPKRGKRAQSAH